MFGGLILVCQKQIRIKLNSHMKFYKYFTCYNNIILIGDESRCHCTRTWAIQTLLWQVMTLTKVYLSQILLPVVSKRIKVSLA